MDMAFLERLKAGRERWMQWAAPQANRRTLSGTEIQPLYDPLDWSVDDYPDKVGFPGEAPFARGISPGMARDKIWSIGQVSGFGRATDAAERFCILFEHGMTGIGVEFDLPTQMGYDSDDPLAEGEVGRVGIAVDSLKDMEVLVRESPLEI